MLQLVVKACAKKRGLGGPTLPGDVKKCKGCVPTAERNSNSHKTLMISLQNQYILVESKLVVDVLRSTLSALVPYVQRNIAEGSQQWGKDVVTRGNELLVVSQKRIVHFFLFGSRCNVNKD